jgi:hypothetical protein
VLVLLSFGLGALLLLNTLLAQGSFTLHTLNAQLTELTDREQALQQRASELAAPQRLARHANALGMVPSQNPAFLREEDGKVLGEPVPAVARVTPAEVVGSDTQDTSSTETNSSSSSGSASTRDDKQNDKPSDQQEQQDNKQDQQGKHDQEKADDGTTNNSEDGGADR